jgi:hypothetical protein
MVLTCCVLSAAIRVEGRVILDQSHPDLKTRREQPEA